jgi:hypothetical protein
MHLFTVLEQEEKNRFDDYFLISSPLNLPLRGDEGSSGLN